jgi:hypothetical protein
MKSTMASAVIGLTTGIGTVISSTSRYSAEQRPDARGDAHRQRTPEADADGARLIDRHRPHVPPRLQEARGKFVTKRPPARVFVIAANCRTRRPGRRGPERTRSTINPVYFAIMVRSRLCNSSPSIA